MRAIALEGEEIMTDHQLDTILRLIMVLVKTLPKEEALEEIERMIKEKPRPASE